MTAERRLLGELEAGCSSPVGALADVVEGDDGEELWIRAVVLSLDGVLSVRRSGSGPLDAADDLGKAVATELLAEGAADLDAPVPPTGPPAGSSATSGGSVP